MTLERVDRPTPTDTDREIFYFFPCAREYIQQTPVTTRHDPHAMRGTEKCTGT